MDPLDESMEPALGPEVLGSLDDPERLNPELEERIVRALRQQGTLTSTPFRRHPPAWRRSVPWLAGAAAATIAFIAGQSTRVAPGIDGASSRGVEAISPFPGEPTVASSLDAAARQYIAALALVQPGDSAGQASAVQTFRSAADQIVRLAPEGSLALAMQIAFPASYAIAPARAETSRSPAPVIWF